MKVKSFLISVIVFVILSCSLAVGCVHYDMAKSLSGSYVFTEVASNDNEEYYQSLFKSGTVDIAGGEAYFRFELSDDTTVEVLCAIEYESISYYYVSGYFVSGESKGYFDFRGDGTLWVRSNGAVHSEYVGLYFDKTGEETNIPDNPDNPGTPSTGNSKFSEIKSGYQNAGYNVNLASDASLDSNVKQLITSLQAQYSTLGYEICFIGKDLDNLMNAELYMLIGTNEESEAKELKQTFDGVYQSAQSGRDIIIYIWTLGSPNFEYFYSAVN